jgi:hypothetical protein
MWNVASSFTRPPATRLFDPLDKQSRRSRRLCHPKSVPEFPLANRSIRDPRFLLGLRPAKLLGPPAPRPLSRGACSSPYFHTVSIARACRLIYTRCVLRDRLPAVIHARDLKWRTHRTTRPISVSLLSPPPPHYHNLAYAVPTLSLPEVGFSPCPVHRATFERPEITKADNDLSALSNCSASKCPPT